MQESIQEVLARHDALHLRFAPDGSSQQIDDDRSISVNVLDISEAGEQQRNEALENFYSEQASTPFDLEQGPLVRPTLIRLGSEEYELVLYGNHLVFDGWSADTIIGELSDAYSARIRGETSALPVAMSYRDYVQMELDADEQGLCDRATQHWADQFSESLPDGLDLPGVTTRPGDRSFDGGTVFWSSSQKLLQEIKATAAKSRTTMFALTLAAYKILLARLTGQEDFVIGVCLSGQALADTDSLVGHGVKLIPLRVQIDSTSTLKDLLDTTRREVLDLWENHATSLGDILTKLSVPRSTDRAPLIEAMFDYSSTSAPIHFERLQTEVKQNPRQHVIFDVFPHLLESDGRLTAAWDYNSEIYDEETVQQWAGHFQTLLENIVANPSANLSELPIISAEQRTMLLDQPSAVAQSASEPACIHQLFEDQVKQDPAAIAVRASGTELKPGSTSEYTYGELDSRASELALSLRTIQAGSGAVVAICMERSVDLLVAILGVLKAGAAYVPVDPSFPKERVDHMLDDAAVRAVITDRSAEKVLEGYTGDRLYVNEDREQLSNVELFEQDVDGNRSPDELAYIIYTSGSTGKPKGVRVTHANVVNFLRSMANQPGITKNDKLLAVTTLSFDISVLELLLPLCFGASVVLASRDQAGDGDQLSEILELEGVTVMQATPATWRLLLGAGWAGKANLKALCGGEAFPQDLAQQLVPKTGELWNMYGPTETTIWSTCYRVNDPDSPILIGKPIENTEVYVLDGDQQPVPVGVFGELFIGGAGVASGYHMRPQLTDERFVENPFRPGPDNHLYRTGDLVRRLKDGNLEYRHRLDNQVKIRGFRIELGEIETALNRYQGVDESVLAIREEVPGDQRLVAFYVPTEGDASTVTELRRHLRSILPDYMMPQHFIQLDNLPRTPNNKIDRKALPALGGASTATRHAFEPPGSSTEVALSRMWQEALRVDKVGLNDNFFELGGHSLLSMSIISRVRQEMGAKLTPLAIVTDSLEQLASEIDRQLGLSGTEEHDGPPTLISRIMGGIGLRQSVN